MPSKSAWWSSGLWLVTNLRGDKPVPPKACMPHAENSAGCARLCVSLRVLVALTRIF
jgi:hypothetical protein